MTIPLSSNFITAKCKQAANILRKKTADRANMNPTVVYNLAVRCTLNGRAQLPRYFFFVYEK